MNIMHGIYKITVMFQVITRRHYLGHRLPPGARQCSEFICSNVVVYDLWLLSTCSNLWLVSWPTCHKQSSMRQKRRHLKVSCKRLVYTECPTRNVRLREGVPYVKVYRYNPKHLCPKLNGYGDNGQKILKL